LESKIKIPNNILYWKKKYDIYEINWLIESKWPEPMWSH